jgi:hypothetical protein
MVWSDLHLARGHKLTACCCHKPNRFPVQARKFPEKWEKCNKKYLNIFFNFFQNKPEEVVWI